jgi:hypothetical protein
MSRALKVAPATVTSGAFSLSYELEDAELITGLELSINTAPVSAGVITVSLDSALGAAYDTVLFSVDPVAGGLTSWEVPINKRFVKGDAIVVAYANPDNRTVSASLYHDLNPAL